MKTKRHPFLFACAFLSVALSTLVAQEPEPGTIFRRENLVAWCIVPFDGKKRGPAARSQMLVELGIKRVAYDWREEHVPTFEQEILEYRKNGLEYFAFWGAHDKAFALFEKHKLSPQIWIMIPQPAAAEQAAKVKEATDHLLPLVDRTRRLGSQLGLYNHGGWSGEPENLVAVCERLRIHHKAEHVGIVYNLHHGHEHIERFPSLLKLMNPYLLCLNLNGMTDRGQKILPIGAGEHDLRIVKTIQDSGYRGPIGLIGHTQGDVQIKLQDNLNGLAWLQSQINRQVASPRPEFRSME